MDAPFPEVSIVETLFQNANNITFGVVLIVVLFVVVLMLASFNRVVTYFKESNDNQYRATTETLRALKESADNANQALTLELANNAQYASNIEAYIKDTRLVAETLQTVRDSMRELHETFLREVHNQKGNFATLIQDIQKVSDLVTDYRNTSAYLPTPAIIIVDKHGSVIAVTQEFLRLTGLDVENVIGHPMLTKPLFIAVKDVFNQPVSENSPTLRHVLETKSKHVAVIRGIFHPKDNAFYWFLIEITPYLGFDNEVQYVAIVLNPLRNMVLPM